MDIKFIVENKKNIITVGVLVLVVLILFQFVYFPKSKEIKRLAGEYKEIKTDMDDLYNFIGGEADLKDNIIKMREKVDLLERAFPSEQEVSDIIKQLNEKARYFKINVISLKPENIEIYKDHNGREVEISDYFCKSMPLTLRVESRYQALGEFLMSLEMNRTPMISIEKVDIEKDEDIKPKIKAKVDLIAYIIGK
ncbi:MAG: type 4a pilus biogenesis protein PilO [Candidatus Omnitrophica bacterium]|nr:type 4a pilus biogenesis protein PilO [Candidatus Omnitrophota bacterium]